MVHFIYGGSMNCFQEKICLENGKAVVTVLFSKQATLLLFSAAVEIPFSVSNSAKGDTPAKLFLHSVTNAKFHDKTTMPTWGR